MTITGHERSAAALLLGSAGFSAAASIALIGPIGPTGAAIATAASLVPWNATMARFLWRFCRGCGPCSSAQSRRDQLAAERSGPRRDVRVRSACSVSLMKF